MLDHVGFPVSDYARSKAFYLRALAPLGYGLVMEVSPEQTGGGSHGGFGPQGAAAVLDRHRQAYPGPGAFRLHGERPGGRSRVSMTPRCKPAARTTVRRDCGRSITPIITAPSSWTPTGTISRPCATCRSKALKRLEAGDAIAISDLETEGLSSGMRSAALPWCPALAGAGPTISARSAPLGGALLGRLLHRLLLGLRLRLHLHSCLSHCLFLFSFSLSRSNQLELENPEQFRVIC